MSAEPVALTPVVLVPEAEVARIVSETERALDLLRAEVASLEHQADALEREIDELDSALIRRADASLAAIASGSIAIDLTAPTVHAASVPVEPRAPAASPVPPTPARAAPRRAASAGRQPAPTPTPDREAYARTLGVLRLVLLTTMIAIVLVVLFAWFA